MARKKPAVSVIKRIFPGGTVKPVIYCEGSHENTYLLALVKDRVLSEYEKGTELTATEITRRVDAIKRDLANDAVEQIYWIVDGCDNHIKQSKPFEKFYDDWLTKKVGDWKKLDILINSPCFEYWFLLHKIDPPVDSNDKLICYVDAKALYDSSEFKKQLPKGKGVNLVKEIANDKIGRKQAIKRAQSLDCKNLNTTKKQRFSVARAEIYRLFSKKPSQN